MQPNPTTSPERTDGPKLAKALASLQGKLPEITKDRTVEIEEKGGGFHSYSYATLSRISLAVLPVLSEFELSWTTRPMLVDGKMVLRYRLMHASGEYLEGDYPIKGDGTTQAVGGAITYARRYSLCAVLGIAPEEDDDAARTQAEEEAAGGGRPTSAQRATKPRKAAAPSAGRGTTAQRTQPGTAPPLPGEDEGPRESTATHPAQPLIIAWGDLGIADRTVRLRYTGALAGRPLQSTNDLTADEIDRIAALVREAKSYPEPIEFLKTKAPQPPAAPPTEGEPTP